MVPLEPGPQTATGAVHEAVCLWGVVLRMLPHWELALGATSAIPLPSTAVVSFDAHLPETSQSNGCDSLAIGDNQSHGGATTIGPDATQPPAICQNLRGVGGRVGDIGSSASGGGPREGGLCATHYYHMHTSRGCVCLGAMGV